MSADGSSPQSDSLSEPLQFDVAEGGGSAARHAASSCARCSAPITTAYYEVNRLIVCPDCRAALATPAGSKLRRVSAAVGLGALAAFGGSILYFAVAAITGREFGLVAIVVGFMVGKAVRKGSRGRGGWAYQTLAVSLTYLAIVSTYVPLIAKEFQNMPARSAHHRSSRPATDTLAVTPEGSAARSAAGDSTIAATQADSGFPISQAGTPTAEGPVATRRPVHLGIGTIVLGILALVLVAAIAPIAAGFSNLIGLLIIGIAVFEAWKLNRRVSLTITRPYRVGGGTDGASRA
jgi:DNA-directed RNA polymerase subunit RPC12/RpoP